MTTWEELARRIFSDVEHTPEEYEALYPPRSLPEGARVTRLAPSPTGFLHLGVFFAAMINRVTADASDGLFYFRLEDTDSKRAVAGGEEDLLRGLTAYGIAIDEGLTAPGADSGAYGPYRQSERTALYHAYVRHLMEQGLAYLCFCSEEQRQADRERQEQEKQRTGYYGPYAHCRTLSPEEALRRIEAGESYVVRLRSPGSEERRIKFDDLIRGVIELPENDEDIVLLKSDGIPTYHFAHAVDDHLMRTTHVIRGEEWVPSVPKHLQLFQVLGFRPPKYAHISPIMKAEGESRRKLSKRKDPEAAMRYYAEQGYPADSVQEYLMTIASSGFEDWRRCNPDAPRSDFPFQLKKMSVSGALFDMDKFRDVSKAVISRMDVAAVTQAVTSWAKEYDPAFHALLSRDPAYAEAIFSIDRGGKKPRKDIACWSEAKDYAAYFYDELYQPSMEGMPEGLTAADARAVLEMYPTVYDPAQEQQEWFAAIKALCPSLGFCPEVKEYKQNPAGWKGHAGDVSTLLRLAVTGRRNTPDLCAILRLLGPERVRGRLAQAAQAL
ncbi:MAG: glutamate--tRNA ligase [Clostridiales bacterium]|nr:glutamate--tRNA ligase [Clostridiales bacterium]